MTDVLTVEVTAEDIRLGTPLWSDSCPMARAVKRTTGYVSTVAVRVTVYNGGWERSISPWTAYAHSTRSLRWMRAFDAGKPVQPARFRLRRVR